MDISTLTALLSVPSVETVVWGAFMGLASTGAHQAFKAFVEGKRSTDTIEGDK